MSTVQLRKLIAPILKMEDLGVSIGLIEEIILRQLFNEGDVSVGAFVDVLGIHATIVDKLLARMKQEHIVEVVRSGHLGSLSFVYTLTDKGTKRARDAFERSQYVGRIPVSLEAYTQAILLQTEQRNHVSPAQVKKALSHLILPDKFDRKIGPAVNAGSSLFLYGPPGNGKTTIAESIGKLLAADSAIWLPDAITVGGQIIRIFDPLVHIPLSPEEMIFHTAEFAQGRDKVKVDNRWRLFKRPIIMVGGELTMSSLDLRFEPTARVYEAPLQFKANGGMFLIDDFGRQQISPQELLNRWIVPLESGIDFLRLQSGQTFEVPFRQLIVFSTNLDPMQLVDGAFLRRIHMKVEVAGPSEKLFYQIFLAICEHYSVPFDKKSFVHLLQTWYRSTNRVMQSVHPRDIVKTVMAICEYEGIPPRFTPDLIDEACDSYFVEGDMAATLADQPINGAGRGTPVGQPPMPISTAVS
jgi:predicted ATPase with chaperone activity